MEENKQLFETTLGAGCFWCVEAVFRKLKGVINVEVGYAGGETPAPSYEDVVYGKTNHAEVGRIVFDPAVISFKEILKVFFTTHDPTSLNKQGADTGPQYRSVIFYHNEEQAETARQLKQKFNKEMTFGKPVVTEISSLKNYSTAEGYHQDFYRNNPHSGYCRVVIDPKLKKLRERFSEQLKD